MEVNPHITTDILKFIDDWWGIIIPLVLMMVFKQWVSDVITWVRYKWSDAPYTGMGNIIQFKEDGVSYKLWRHSIKNIFLKKLNDKEEETGYILKMNMYEYTKTRIIYKEV